MKKKDGSIVRESVTEILKTKHSDPHPPHSSSLLSVNELPLFEDIEITGAHIYKIVFSIQGGAGPGGCDASHWNDVLL